jgi:hypothetical protein
MKEVKIKENGQHELIGVASEDESAAILLQLVDTQIALEQAQEEQASLLFTLVDRGIL